MGGNGGKVLQGIGKTRGGWGTKIHVLTDALGNPIKLKISEGQINDNVPAIEILQGMFSKYLSADKAYDTNDIRAFLEKQKIEAVIPNLGRRVDLFEYDIDIYKERHLVECFFQKVKRLRRIAMRFEKKLEMFQGIFVIACILVWLK
jgi:transposase